MQKLTFENQGSNTYMVYAVSPEDEIDSMSLGMLTNNKIPGLADSIFTQMNTTKYIKYNVTAKVPASYFFSTPANKKRILGVFNGIVDAMLSAEDYAIDAGTILLDLDYIFVDVATCKTVLLCLPVLNRQDAKVDINSFLKNILVNTPLDPNENGDYMYKLLEYLKHTSSFSLEGFKEKLREAGANSQTPAPAAKPVQKQVKNQIVKNIETPAEFQKKKEKPAERDMKTPPEPVPEKNVERPKKEIPFRNEGMAIPPGPQQKKDVPPIAENEPEMSLFHLLQHYNKENAAIYKAQKEARKVQKQPKGIEKSGKEPKKKKKAEQQARPDFNMPGREIGNAGSDYARQNAEWQAPQNMAQSSQNVIRQTPQNAEWQMPPQKRQDLYREAPQEIPAGNADFGNTVFYGADEDDKTTFMNRTEEQSIQLRPRLVRKKNNEIIPVNEPVFRLGRTADFNSYVIPDNRFVGHSHCHIVTRDDEFFVVDDNSKNHTFVNGAMIPPGTEVKISHGQTISLADEEFEFKLY